MSLRALLYRRPSEPSVVQVVFDKAIYLVRLRRHRQARRYTLRIDAASREECTAERVRSNTPQQALTLLNDPTYVEAARGFASRILKECDGDNNARITWAFRTALSRDPSPAEKAIVAELLEKQLARYRFDMPAANALTSVGESAAGAGLRTGELAAWTNVARTILNLHETITRN